jgi:hypothetical protein
MRRALLHVTTGLLLGLAVAGLIRAPSEVVAQHDARAPFVRPQPGAAGPWTQEQTIRVSPRLERALERRRRELLAPPRIQPPVLPSLRSVPALVPDQAGAPTPPAAIPIALTPDPPRVARRPEPDPPDAAPPPPAHIPATPRPPAKPVASTPQPTQYRPASHDNDDGSSAKRKKDKRDDRGRDRHDRDHDDRGDRDRDDDHDRGDRHDDDDD